MVSVFLIILNSKICKTRTIFDYLYISHIVAEDLKRITKSLQPNFIN